MKKKNIWCSVMVFLIVVFDQATKYLVSYNLKSGKIVDFLPGIVRFRYAENTGMAFSMFSGSRWVFVALTVLVCGLGIWFLFSGKCKNLWEYWSIGVIIAGGVGNLIDRVAYGFVVDFIEPTFMNFAVFNIADCAVTLGAISLVIYLVVDIFKSEKKEKKDEIA